METGDKGEHVEKWGRTKTMQPTISVIISIYNIEKYIIECVESVIKQSYAPIEILLVNDGSTDGSLSICKEYESRFPDVIKIIDKKMGSMQKFVG